jgi:acyl carrier protein phosphodiesterase
MNWLAHLYLSEPCPAFRIGNLLPDLAPVSTLKDLPEEYQRGMAHHRRIDAFTDAHPVVHRSIARVPAPFRRFAGILTDVFYDYFLAREWRSFSKTPLPDFAAEVYASFSPRRHELPAEAYIRLEHMRQGDLLCSYRDRDGIAAALGRIGARLRRPVDLAAAVDFLEQYEDAFREDFTEFFWMLRGHLGRGT